MQRETIYHIQSSFATGEISPEVANRIDLDKYAAALLTAENAYIRPYGSVYKRGGTLYCGMTKTEKVILKEFTATDGSFMLEMGDRYIRIWKGNNYTGIELVTPFTENELKELRTCQSADVMFIASGTHPIQKLSRYSDTNWIIGDYEIKKPYFDISLSTEMEGKVDTAYDSAGNYTFNCKKDGTYTITIAGGGGGGAGGTWQKHFGLINKKGGDGGRGAIITKKMNLTKGTTYNVKVGEGGSGGEGTYGENGTDGTPSSFDGITAVGGKRGLGNGSDGDNMGNGGIGGTGGTGKENGTPGDAGWVNIKLDAELSITPSGTTGNITLAASKNYFSENMVGAYVQISQELDSQTVTQNGNGTSGEVLCGKAWKVITHGTWTGTVTVQKSTNNGPWKDYRTYKANDDFNASESGTVEEYTRLRIVATAGNTDLTALPYTHVGMVKITGYISPTEVNAEVIDSLANTNAADYICLNAWNDQFGYPSAIGFFQDRLCVAATKKQPYMLWLSRSGDYNNFSVEKISGTVTDDSAVALAFINRKQQTIEHLVPESDLVIMTGGNEWILSGGTAVTPTKANPKMQTSRGTTNVIPLSIGGRVIFVQHRGKTVRDMQYRFESDSYDGADLTLLAKHITKNTTIEDMAYMQEPDSKLYFVLSDGTMACLSYIQDQKVYAWSRIKTEGKVMAVCNVENQNEDNVYIAVKRGNQTYIEELCNNKETENPKDYIMLDASVKITETTAKGSVPHLPNAKIGVLADGRYYEKIQTDEGGNFTLPQEASYIIAGLPYTMTVELPNLEINTKTGTIQGWKKKVSAVTLRLNHSLGGRVGIEKTNTLPIKYDEFSEQDVVLYSGDKHITMPNRGFELTGRTVITSDEPYPFNLSAVVREVELDG